jgi:putative SOS response-associated peptidase YedK
MCYSVLVEQDLRRLALDFDAIVDEAAFKAYNTLHNRDPKKFRDLTSNPRIYPLYFAPVLVTENEERSIRPMRYRLRPCDASQEVPTKYNLFNARLDSLETRATWSKLFGRRHGLLVARSFYEWVTRENKKQVIAFHARAQEFLSIPVLYDTWSAPDGQTTFSSFALITGEPTPEILAAGHDRCPLVLPPEALTIWLQPQKHSRAELKHILQHPLSLTFEAQLAKP